MADTSRQQDRHRWRKSFEHSKAQCLGKRDKSFAGRIDVKAVEICSVLNDRKEFYTTSSCAGRCFLYQGHGIKSTHFLSSYEDNVFRRCRISHDRVHNAQRYFDLSTMETDPTGGGDPIRTIGQFEHMEQLRLRQSTRGEAGTENDDESPSHVKHEDEQQLSREEELNNVANNEKATSDSTKRCLEIRTTWLRFEPFILHVSCRSLTAASALMAAARPSFKNVGLTSWKESKYLVAVWGDEGLDMPLSTPDGKPVFLGHETWLQQLVNERHERNWSKIDKFVQSIRALPQHALDLNDEIDNTENTIVKNGKDQTKILVPRSFDVVGDVAVLHSMPDGIEREEDREALGQIIMKKNKAIKLCAVRTTALGGTERAPGELTIIAGARRDPLITTHSEYGIKCVVDLNKTFFSPRMGPERLRICGQVARGEKVLVLFAGIGMEALQIAGRTEASRVVAVELNPAAVRCARNAHKMLSRNKGVTCLGAAERLEIIEGDVLKILPSFVGHDFDRVLAPRPKEGDLDGDLGDGSGGKDFLRAILPVLKEDGGECHWYDFAADHELPTCQRTQGLIQSTCSEFGLMMEVVNVASAGSVAMRQHRVCVDFRIRGKPPT